MEPSLGPEAPFTQSLWLWRVLRGELLNEMIYPLFKGCVVWYHGNRPWWQLIGTNRFRCCEPGWILVSLITLYVEVAWSDVNLTFDM